MRRALSILLALLFGLGPLASALPASEDARLPACCRRNGAHHCAMGAHATAQEAAPDGRTSVSAPMTCPYYPGAVMALFAPAHALLAPPANFVIPESSAPALSFAHISARTAPARTHAGRGPPVSILG
jgi:hypothetical protein